MCILGELRIYLHLSPCSGLKSVVTKGLIKCRSRGCCAADPDRTLTATADRDPLVALGPLVAFWPINSEISALPGFLVNCQLGMGASRPMDGQAHRVLQLATTAAVVAPIANGSNHAPWFPSGARAWAVCGHGANSANSNVINRAVVALFSTRRPEIRAPLLLCFLLLCLVLS